MKEFADFLGSQPPYDALDAEDLTRLACRVEVEYFTVGTTVVSPEEGPLSHLWVVRTGALEVVDRGRVVDLLGPGDTFGHISVLTRLAPALSVRAVEDSLCLRLPDPRTLVAHPEKLQFAHFGTLIARQRLTRGVLPGTASSTVRGLMRPVVWCGPGDPVREVARAIGERGAASCAVVRGPLGLGIVTDRDFRERVATGAVPLDAPVAELATFPALSVDEETTQAEAFVRMVEAGVHHLVVTGDAQQAVGVLRVVDFAATEIRNPLMIRAALESASTIQAVVEASRLLPSTLVELHDRDVPALHIGSLLAAVVDVIVRKLVSLHDGSTPAVSWVVLGSLARREPLPGSDVDTALVWEQADAAPVEGAGDVEMAGQLRARAAALLDDLERCGLQRCPHGANANNALFSRSSSHWTAEITRWVADPAATKVLLLSALVADNRPLVQVPLGRTLTDAMGRAPRDVVFLNAFLREALAHKPPTGFVRDFVVDHAGHHRGQLNLKRGGLVPIASVGRWAALVSGDARGRPTPQRLRNAVAEGLLSQGEGDTLLGAFEDIYGLLLDGEIRAIRGAVPPSNYISPTDLNSLTRRHLRESFRAIAAVQGRLEVDGLARLAR